MEKQSFKDKRKEWLRRYIVAELLGTVVALLAAWIVYAQSGSFIVATAAGWIGEGVGFYGYFITVELLFHATTYKQYKKLKRISLALAATSANIFMEFMPAEILDNLLLRPFLMYLAPHYIHPYPVGFLAGKLGADVLFYTLVITAYEARKHWLHH